MSISELVIKVTENAKDIEWLKLSMLGIWGLYVPHLVNVFKKSKSKSNGKDND